LWNQINYILLKHKDVIYHSLVSEMHLTVEYCLENFQSGPDERSVPGNTIAVQADMPFSGLTRFGTAFLSKFECSQMPHPVSH